MIHDSETEERIKAFNLELASIMKSRFKELKMQVNGSGKPTAGQLAQCVLESGAEVQRHGEEFLEEYLYNEFMEPLQRHPEYAGSVMPFYEACCDNF
ncbi:hypothetical protein AUJ64_03960 [Candidatus Pacearchaeota archaeon CG1_02_39_14]|nr:MAG: hypothetical protein AUJ64_03960 [Candidatus Pacearchaeota archaeon CG1_02_39_14]